MADIRRELRIGSFAIVLILLQLAFFFNSWPSRRILISAKGRYRNFINDFSSRLLYVVLGTLSVHENFFIFILRTTSPSFPRIALRSP